EQQYSEVDNKFISSRGLDIAEISNVINFDCPQSAERYIHRVGRTARDTSKGISVTFITPKETELSKNIFTDIESMLGHQIQSFNFSPKHIDSLRYRCTVNDTFCNN
ncbi:MAG: putative ATP-dependent RNA helicase ddx56, partial [Paramarteilia canceri]